MRRFFRRSIVWLLPVVFVPFGVLLVMQYQSLRRLEKTTVSAEWNHLRSSVEEVAREIESYYRVASESSLAIPAARLGNEPALSQHFKDHPIGGAKTYFAIRYDGEGECCLYFGPGGERKGPPEEEVKAVKLATVSWHVMHKYQSVLLLSAPSVDERDTRNRVITRPITNEALNIVGVSGVILDEEAARRTIDGIAAGTAAMTGTRDHLNVKIGPEFVREPNGRDYITQSLGFVFTNWRAGVRDSLASPEEIAACNFRLNMMWTGGAAFVLFGGIMLALQAVARQMRLSQMKSEFVSNVSHELRTPLSSIRVFGEYMRLGRVTKPEKIQEYGEYIEAESRRLTALINNILDFSKIESAEKKYRFQEADIVETLEQTIAAVETPLREHGVSITFQAPEAPIPLLSIDKDAIGQALVNLLDNAVKYSGDRKEITARVVATREQVRISVSDRGIGMATCEHKKIFDKFYRVGSGLVHDVKGSGLGLAIVKHVALAHGGDVEVASAPGEGSTFTIRLPITRPAPVAVATTEYA